MIYSKGAKATAFTPWMKRYYDPRRLAGHKAEQKATGFNPWKFYFLKRL